MNRYTIKPYPIRSGCEMAGCGNLAKYTIGIKGTPTRLLTNLCDDCIKDIADLAVENGIVSNGLKKKLALSESYSIVQQQKTNTDEDKALTEAKPKAMDAVELLNLLNLSHLKDIGRGFKILNVHTMTKEQLITEILDRALNK